MIAAVAVGGGAWAVTREDTTAEASTTMAEASVGTYSETVTSTGTFQPATTAELTFAVSGEVMSVAVEEGDVVEAGQILATVDSETFEAELAAAEANLDAAQEQLDSDTDADASDTQLAADEASVTAAESRVALAEEALANADLTSTISGTVASMDIAVGDEVSGGDSGGTSGAANGMSGGAASTSGSTTGSTGAQITVITTDSFIVETSVGSADLGRLTEGLQAEMTPSDTTDTVYGTVSSVGLVASSSGSGSATFPVDWDNLWAVGSPDHPVELDYTDIVVRWYAAIHRQHVQVDVRKADHDLSAYDVVIAPLQYLLPEAAAANLAGYVRRGGHLLVAGLTDIVDEHDAFRDGGFLTQLGLTLGIRLEDFGALPAGSRVSFRLDGSDHVGTTYAEEIQLAGATVLARFSTGHAADRPAFTSHQDGAGAGYYLATLPDDHGMRAVTRHVFDRAGVTAVLPAAHPDVEAIRAGEHLVVINHGEQARVVALDSGHVLDDVPVTELQLEPYGCTVVQGPLDPPASATGAQRHAPARTPAVQPAGGTPVISMATRSARPTAHVRPGGGTG